MSGAAGPRGLARVERARARGRETGPMRGTQPVRTRSPAALGEEMGQGCSEAVELGAGRGVPCETRCVSADRLPNRRRPWGRRQAAEEPPGPGGKTRLREHLALQSRWRLHETVGPCG